MNKTFTLVMLFFCGIVFSQTYDADETWGVEGTLKTFTLTEDVVISSPAILTIYGDLADSNKDQLVVNSGAILIIYGDLELENTNSELAGDIIVIGDVTLKNTDMIGSSNLIVGGTLFSGGGNLNGVSGDVYLLDLAANPNPPTLPNDPKTAEDFVDDETLSLVELVGISVGGVLSYTWEGSTDDNWSDSSNWGSGAVPTEVNSVSVPDDASAIRSLATCSHGVYSMWNLTVESGATVIIPSRSRVVIKGDLTVEAGASVIIEDGSQVTISGDVDNLGSLIINNSISSPISIIIDGNVVGNSTVNWDLTEMAWWYIGHSATGITESHYDSSFAGGSSDYALNRYNGGWERIAGINEIYSEGEYPFDAPLEGYSLVIRNADETLSYSGVLNNATTYSNTYNPGWHLIANPYPSYIDITHEDFHIGDFEQVVYIRKNDGAVATCYLNDPSLATNGGSQYIAPGQCMWMRNAASETISIRSGARVHSVGSLKGASAVSDVLRLSLSSSYGNDEMLLAFREYGSDYYTGIDSEKLMSTGKSANIYSVKEDKDVVINILPEIYQEKSIAIAYSVVASGMTDFVISADNINAFSSNYNVFLSDKYEAEIIDLREEPTYNFTPTAATVKDRFELIVQPIATGIEDDGRIMEENILVYAVGQVAVVRVGTELLKFAEGKIEVYNLAGKRLSVTSCDAEEVKVPLPQSRTVYIIKVSIGSISHHEKVIG